jgi:hypothetical protein
MDKNKLMKQHVERWQSSGKTILQYCNDNNLSYDGFNSWRYKNVPETRILNRKKSFLSVPIEGLGKSDRMDGKISIDIEPDGTIHIRLGGR